MAAAARSGCGVKTGLAITIAYTFYCGVTTVAALLPAYTGLILTIEGVVLLGIVMQVLAHHRDLRLRDFFELLQNKNASSLEEQKNG